MSRVSITSEILFIGEEPDPNGVNDWPNGNAIDLIEESTPTTGLLLPTDPDGSLTEKRSAILMNPQSRIVEAVETREY